MSDLFDSDKPYHQKSKFILFKNFAKQDQDVFAG